MQLLVLYQALQISGAEVSGTMVTQNKLSLFKTCLLDNELIKHD